LLLVKHAGLALPDPTASSETNYEASTLACSRLVAALNGIVKFCSLNHLDVIWSV
jgi:hypothetical protein